MSKQNGASILAVNGNGNGAVPHLSSPNDFPIPLEGIITVRLDTGRVVDMVIGELSMLYEVGEIPDDLKPIAAKQLFPAAQEKDSDREKRYWERFRVVKWLVERVTLGTLDVARLYHDEIWQIYNMANNPAAAMENFRRQQTGDVGALSGLENMGTAAEPTLESATAQERLGGLSI